MKKTKIIIFFLLIIFNFFGYNSTIASSGDYGQLGGNTDNLVDWSRNWMFADSVKQVRQFVVGLPRSLTGAKLGEDGYPLEDFAGVIMTAQEVGSIAGTYHGTLTVRNDAPDVSFNLGATAGTVINKTLSGKTLTFDAVIGTGANQIMFNVNKTNGGVSDFHLYRPGYGSGDIFTKEFLEHTKMLSAIRFMDAVKTNNSLQKKWSDRKLPNNPQQSYSGGIAREYVIELANQTKKDIWINIPHAADDDYVINLAKLIKEKLDPSLKVYVEYSNEVWNSMFQQYFYNQMQAKIDVENGINLNYDNCNNSGYRARRRMGERIKQISDLFKTVYGEENMMTKIRPILATQGAYFFVTEQQTKYLYSQYGDLSKYIYGIGIAPYMGLSLSGATTPQDLSNFVRTEGLKSAKKLFEGNAKIATKYRVKLVAYEGGFDVYGTSINKDLVKQYFDSELLKNDLTAYFNSWREISNGGLFMWYFYGASNRDIGYIYGTTDNLKNTNTFHIQAIKEYLNSSYAYKTANEWYDRGVYTAKAGTQSLNINYDYSGSVSKKYFLTGSISKSGTGFINGYNYYSTFPFIDLMKSATNYSSGWGGDDRGILDLDQNGWLKFLKNIKTGEIIGGEMVILSNLPKNINNQNLIVYYDGEGDISINQGTEIYEKSIPGRKVFKLNLNTGNYALIISDIYKQNPLRNIHVVREDQDELFKKGVIFNPDWINSIKGYKTINFSQWINISMKNNATLTGITSPNYYTYVNGAPYEVMVGLLNSIESDGVVDLGTTVSADYVDKVKKIIKDYKKDTIKISLIYKGKLVDDNNSQNDNTSTGTIISTGTTVSTGTSVVKPKPLYNNLPPTVPLVLNYDLSGKTSKSIYGLPQANTKSGTINLNVFNYWLGITPFIDLMKSGTPFTSSWGGDDTPFMDLDENGWLKSMKNTSSGTTFPLIKTILVSNGATLSGSRLVVYYEGEGSFSIFGGKDNSSLSKPGRQVFDVPSSAGNISLFIFDTNPKNYLRNIHVVREDQDELFKKGVIFNPIWIDSIKKYKTVNFSTRANWNEFIVKGKDKTNINSPTYIKGFPYEVMIALINATDIQAEYNFPKSASELKIQEFISVIKNNLLSSVIPNIYYNGVKYNITITPVVLSENMKFILNEYIIKYKIKLDSTNIQISSKINNIDLLISKFNSLSVNNPKYNEITLYINTKLKELKDFYNSNNIDQSSISEVLNTFN